MKQSPTPSVSERLIEVYSNEKAAEKTTKDAIAQTCPKLGFQRTVTGVSLGAISTISTFMAPQLAQLFDVTATTPLGWMAAAAMIAFPSAVSFCYIFKSNVQWRMGENLRSKETAGLARQVLGLTFKDRNDAEARGEIGTARSSIGALPSLAENRYQEIESSTSLVVAFVGLLWINPTIGGLVMLSSLYLRSIEKRRTEVEKDVVKRASRWQGLFHDANQAALDPDSASQLDAMGKSEWQAERVERYSKYVAKLTEHAAHRHLALTRKGWLVTGTTSLAAGAIMCYLAFCGSVTVNSVASFIVAMLTLQGTMWHTASLRGERERVAIKVQRNATLGRELPRALAEKDSAASAESVDEQVKDGGEQNVVEKPSTTPKQQHESELEIQSRRDQNQESLALSNMTENEREWYERLKGKQLGLRATDLRYHKGDTTILHIPGTLTVRPGELVAIVGESGAGKSTLIRLIVGVLDATGGSMDVLLRDPDTNVDEVVPRADIPRRILQSFIAWSPQGGYAGRSLRIQEYVDLGRSPTGRTQLTTSAALDFSGISGLAQRHDITSARIGYDTNLSGGEVVRLRDAQAAVGNKPIEIWDEPHEGLDPRTKRHIVTGILRQRGTGKSVLYVTHDYAGLQHVDRIIVIHDGKVVGDGTPDEVGDTCEEYREQLTMQRDFLPALKPRVAQVPHTPNLATWDGGQEGVQ
jgi:ABC-type multidrug transport system fused ATPase/permease subunit